MSIVQEQALQLKALGHPVRLGIAMRLAEEGGTCACDFADIFHVSQPTVSQHLKVLRDAGLVQTRRRGTQILYSLDSAAMRALGLLVGSPAAETARLRRPPPAAPRCCRSRRSSRDQRAAARIRRCRWRVYTARAR